MSWTPKKSNSSSPSSSQRRFSRPNAGPNASNRNPIPRGKRDFGTSWEHSADWYDRILGEKGSNLYQRVVIPQGLELLQPKTGESILDLGCGQGVFSRAMADKGAFVTGVDLSPSLIQKAKTYKGARPIKYFTRDAAEITDLGPFDAASAILCLQNMPHLDKVCESLNQVLKPGGRMLWVMNHPCFRIPRQTSWGFDESKKIQYRRLDTYSSPLSIPIVMHPGKAQSESTVSFHHSLTDLFGKAFAAGFSMIGLKEGFSDKVSEPGPRGKAENRARNEFPLFISLLWQKRGA